MLASYVISLDPKERSGLYKAVFNRIDKSICSSVFNLNCYDSYPVRIMKYFFGIKVSDNEVLEEDFGVKINNVNVKVTLGIYVARHFKIGKTLEDKIVNLLFSRMKASMPDVIIAHGGGISTNVATLFSEKYKVNQVNIFHGSDIHSMPSINHCYKKKLLRDMKNAKMNVFVSNKLLEASKTFYQKDNVTVIRNGIDLSTSVGNYDLPEKKGYKIAYIGNLYNVKGVDRIPEIAKNVKLKVDASFYIIGNGSLMKFLESNMPTDTVFTGAVNNKYVKSILSQIDLVILPSRNEGLPIVLCEALTMRKKIVATNVGGIPELIDRQFLVESDSLTFVDDFSLKVINALESSIIPLSKYDISINKMQESERKMLEKFN